MNDPKSIEAFKRRMKQLGCVLLPKVHGPNADVLLAERKTLHGAEVIYETYWMACRDGIDFGRCVRNSFIISQNERIAEALDDAMNFIAVNVRNKRYG